ncbi:hypothetical protein [Caulobacter sp. S45]|uniref:hypothetical protein n=1 Tax=Caulobacter sp. S45 TaxID=1641861 RepID=UPI00131C0EB2|nr:hypothetical protein [Caulobacter sp. S45]
MQALSHLDRPDDARPWARSPPPPMRLSPAARGGLLALRGLLGVATAQAGYAFVHEFMR